MNILLRKCHSRLIFFIVLICSGFSFAGENPGNTESKKEEAQFSGNWFNKISFQHKKIIGVLGVGLVALAINQVVVMPFLLSAACGFAVEQDCIKNTITEAARFNKLTLQYREMSDGLYDGLAYFGLSNLTKIGWFSTPVYAGLFVGQLAAIGINNPRYCHQAVLAWRNLQSKKPAIPNQQITSDAPEPVLEAFDSETIKEMRNRFSMAILTCICMAGVTGKFSRLFKR